MVLYPCKLKDFVCPAMVWFYFENHLHVNLLNYEVLDLLLDFQWIKNSNARAVEQPCVYWFSLSVTFHRNEIYIAPSGVQKERIQVCWTVFLPQSSSWDGWKYLCLEFHFSLCKVRNLLYLLTALLKQLGVSPSTPLAQQANMCFSGQCRLVLIMSLL